MVHEFRNDLILNGYLPEFDIRPDQFAHRQFAQQHLQNSDAEQHLVGYRNELRNCDAFGHINHHQFVPDQHCVGPDLFGYHHDGLDDYRWSERRCSAPNQHLDQLLNQLVNLDHQHNPTDLQFDWNFAVKSSNFDSNQLSNSNHFFLEHEYSLPLQHLDNNFNLDRDVVLELYDNDFWFTHGRIDDGGGG